MINLDRLDFFSGTLESLNGSLKDGINPKSFHFVAVSTLVASDLDQYTLEEMILGEMVCDSRYISLFSGLFGEKVKQIRGTDFLKYTLEHSQPSVRHLFLGTTQETLKLLKSEIETRYPNVSGARFQSLPFSNFENLEQFSELDDFLSPKDYDIVWVALGSPKQDRVAIYISKKFGVNAIAVGAAIEFLSGAKKEAPGIVRLIGAEWLFRLITEPRRLWRRYTLGNTIFILYVIRAIFAKRIRRR
jgi:N-acetylglucosaminyldiphosphoundecaprenol N-acetyl-beta-D-mannosaminyltransferase